MASTSETGHAKNVSSFDELISFATGYGATFNPSKASIKVPALQAQSTASKSAVSAVNAALSAYSNAVSAREVAFEPLGYFGSNSATHFGVIVPPISVQIVPPVAGRV